jgi:hypothetical protein
MISDIQLLLKSRIFRAAGVLQTSVRPPRRIQYLESATRRALRIDRVYAATGFTFHNAAPPLWRTIRLRN